MKAESEITTLHTPPFQLLKQENVETTTNINIFNSTSHVHVINFTLHPGYTTLISFGVSLFLITLYLYYDILLKFIYCATCQSCRKKSDFDSESIRPASTLSKSGTNAEYSNCVDDSRGYLNSKSDTVVEFNERDMSLWQSELTCDCGQVHKARHCIRSAHFKNDFETFMKSVSTLSESLSPGPSSPTDKDQADRPLIKISAPKQDLKRPLSLPVVGDYSNRNTFDSKATSQIRRHSPNYTAQVNTLESVPETGPSSSVGGLQFNFIPRHIERSLSTVT